MASSTKVTVEYAKSGRSSCKKCDEKIPAKSVRLGLVSKHPQGFDQTKWHHLDCFPFSSDIVSSVEDITGFSLLQACIGSKSCSLGVSINVFGEPCKGVAKSLAVEASCT